PARYGLQQLALHPHPLSDDEPRLCRPRLLLRRSRLPAGGAASRTAREGLCRGPPEADQLAAQRSGGETRRPLPLRGEEQSLSRSPGEVGSAGGQEEVDAAAEFPPR